MLRIISFPIQLSCGNIALVHPHLRRRRGNIFYLIPIPSLAPSIHLSRAGFECASVTSPPPLVNPAFPLHREQGIPHPRREDRDGSQPEEAASRRGGGHRRVHEADEGSEGHMRGATEPKIQKQDKSMRDLCARTRDCS